MDGKKQAFFTLCLSLNRLLYKEDFPINGDIVFMLKNTLSPLKGSTFIDRIFSIDFSVRDLAGITFKNCIFKNVSFVRFNLTRVVFENCKFTDVVFDKAILKGSTFFECDLDPTNSFNASIFKYADLSYSNLTGVCIDGANLRGVSFDGCTLSAAALSNCDLSSASFKRAYVDDTYICDCKIDGCDFSEAREKDTMVFLNEE